MRTRLLALIAVLVLSAGVASAQTTGGEIYGKVTDTSSAVVPGATVTISSPVLLQPLTAITNQSGSYRFPGVAIGVYSVKFEMAGFKTVIREGLRIELGLNAQVNGSLAVSTVAEVVTVSGEAAVIDIKDASRTNRFTQEVLQGIPTARDPWVIIQQAAGVAMDRENVGGNMSGQQSNFVARGASFNQQKWNLDGVDITDMSALGGSPVYYDFDAFEEMQISTGGADVVQQTPGVNINLVTKSGTDKFRGSGRYLITDDSLESNNVSQADRQQGATSGNPIQNIKDYGFEVGGPIVKGKAWFWGSYGKQDIKVGVNNFFLKTPECAAVTPSTAINYSIDQVRQCMNTDLTALDTLNFKVSVQPFKKNQVSLLFNQAGKIRNARGADDLHPIESTNRQLGVENDALGSSLWKTGKPKTYKFSDRHIFSDRFMMDLQYAHVGNNFVLDFHDPSLASVQPSFEITTSLWGRSFNASQFVRPTDSFEFSGNYSTAGMGGDNAIKFGARHRKDESRSLNHYGGNMIARFRNGVPAEAEMRRDSDTDYFLYGNQFYLQDTFTKGKWTVNAGLRFDQQWDKTAATSVPAHPFFGQSTITGATFNHLPALSFAGAEGGVKFNDLQPRVGINYDIKGNGRSVAKLHYSRYASQLGTGDISGTYNPVQQSFIRFPWTDLNGDKFVQANEVNITGTPLSFGGNYNPSNPSALSSPGTNNPNLSNEHTDEFVVSFDHQFGRSFAFSAAYIYRKYTNFRWNDTTGLSSANYVPVNFTPTCTVSGARCDAVTYYQPNIPIPAAYVYTNRPDLNRVYNGFEITGRKRMSNKWMLNGSFAWNDTVSNYLSANAYEDPSNIDRLNGGQYAQATSGSGLDNVYVNAKWIGRLSAAYELPWQINLAGFYNARSGYPFPQGILTPSRANSAGTTTIYLDLLGDNRYETYQQIDLNLSKSFKLTGSAKLKIGADVFNLFNVNTVQSRRINQAATNANQISAVVAPRVMRFGANLSF